MRAQPRAGTLLLVMLTATACGESGRLVDPGAPSLAKGGGPAGTPSVSAATPAYGYRGETDKAVTISGSGFEPGAVATWERGGVTDGKVVVTSTQFVSSSQLVATLDIAADADISFYDVAVTTLGGKKGIGTEKFEVTTAVVPTLDGAGNNSYAWGMNAAGQIVGRSNGNAFFWDPSTGLDNLGTGQAFDVSEDPAVIVGTNSTGTDGRAMLWAGGAGAWSAIQLPVNCVTGSVTASFARAISRNGALAGGNLRVQTGRKNSSVSVPVTWDVSSGTCNTLPLPPGVSDVGVMDVNGLGMAAGRSFIWYEVGTPSAAVVSVSGLSGNASFIQGLNESGTLAVGLSGGSPVYWYLVDAGTRTWSAAVRLTPASCSTSSNGWAVDANDAGVIVGKDCSGTATWWAVSGSTVVSMNPLPGLGSKGNGTAEAITSNTTSGSPWVAGASSDRAVYWNRP